MEIFPRERSSLSMALEFKLVIVKRSINPDRLKARSLLPISCLCYFVLGIEFLHVLFNTLTSFKARLHWRFLRRF